MFCHKKLVRSQYIISKAVINFAFTLEKLQQYITQNHIDNSSK